MEVTSDPSNIISASKQIMYHGSTYGLLEYSIDGSMLRNCTLQIMYDMLSGCAFCFVVKKKPYVPAILETAVSLFQS